MKKLLLIIALILFAGDVFGATFFMKRNKYELTVDTSANYAEGNTAGKSGYDAEDVPFTYRDTEEDPDLFYFRIGAAGNWTVGFPVTGANVDLQATETHIQWSYPGSGTWHNLVALSEISGTTGAGIPAGGTSGQLIKKNSATDYDVAYVSTFNADIALPNIANQQTAGQLGRNGIAVMTMGNGTEVPDFFPASSQISGMASMTTAGTMTLFGEDTAYGAGWDGDLQPPSKNAVYDKINSLNLLSIVDSMPGSPSVGTIYLDRSDGKIKIFDDDNAGQTGLWTLAEALAFTDTLVPTLVSATIPSAGTSITLVLSENCDVGAGGNGGWTLNTPTNAMTYSSGDGTNTYVYTLAATIYDSDTPTVSYTQPGNGLEDVANNDLATISGAAVTNNSTQTSLACGGSHDLGHDDDLSSSGNLNTSYWYAVKYTATATDAVGCIKVRVAVDNSETTSVGWGIYSHDAGNDRPNAQLAFNSTSSHVWTDGATLNEFLLDASESLTADTVYWIVLHSDGTSALLFERSGSVDVKEVRYLAGTYDTAPANGAAWSSLSDANFSWSAW